MLSATVYSKGIGGKARAEDSVGVGSECPIRLAGNLIRLNAEQVCSEYPRSIGLSTFISNLDPDFSRLPRVEYS